MDEQPISSDTGMPEHHFVKADEIDQTGADIRPVSDEQLMEEVAEGLRGEQAPGSTNSASDELPKQAASQPRRPPLRRGGVAPPPPLQPPPPAPVQQPPERPSDSLTLAQIREIMGGMPKMTDQPAYAFEYSDSQPFADELEEWFQYSEFDRVMLIGMRLSFEQRWTAFCACQSSVSDDIPWITASHDLRKSFMDQTINDLWDDDFFARVGALEAVCYAVAGVWGLTAGKTTDDYPEEVTARTAAETPKSKSLQIKWMENNVSLLQESSGITELYQYFCRVFDRTRTDSDFVELENESPVYAAVSEREANLILTALYFIVEVGRRQEARDNKTTPIRDEISNLNPNLLMFFVEIIARLRWDESASIPLTRIVLLFWKLILLCFGGSESLRKAKAALEPWPEKETDISTRRTPFLTASPLDYHAFRQEIASKYPAYNPPPPIVPLELENNSILPPLPPNPSRANSSTGLFSGVGPSTSGDNGSILHQSVHIATPAPSPPPSPIGPGGKAGKKHNYQTNQNFPFMYPPLSQDSNDIGGKGSTEHQDVLVGKKWEGSDVPASIIEAGQLFSSHVKMTRGIRQLWEERERFMKYDRGWNFEDCAKRSTENPFEDVAEGVQNLDLSEKNDPGFDGSPEKETDNEDVQQRLNAVESFYARALPHLQSITIVFLKIILTNISVLVNHVNNQNGHMGSNGYASVNGSGQSNASEYFDYDAAVDELDNIRLREVTGKAVSGTLLLLVKWFKRSHILKFEYISQLLLDSNYLPLILKMFAHQDIEQAVAQKNDREDFGFFHFCRCHTDNPQQRPGSSGDESYGSEEEAVPPPILRHQQDLATGDSSVQASSPEESLPDIIDNQIRPEVDELGYPIAPPPKEPITTFSFRNFFSTINYLHVMQKITRGKAHRCLLLVQYKSSAMLRRGLKIPDPHLRYYTLKLFKSQVPYCGRKWRQSNMRVITAIYLYCRPSLRDDWISGLDVDAEVEEALPFEQALRGLTHWWHLRRYKDVMGGEEGTSLMEEERDFFVRELEALGWGMVGDDYFDAVGAGGEGEIPVAGPLINGTEWDGGPLQMEGL